MYGAIIMDSIGGPAARAKSFPRTNAQSGTALYEVQIKRADRAWTCSSRLDSTCKRRLVHKKDYTLYLL
jgi:hypothetical protein